MLAAVVVVFATLWLPYRGLLVYNSFATLFSGTKYMDLWFLLFAKTCVFINSAINPILYNAMSGKFRRAFRKTLVRCARRLHSAAAASGPADSALRTAAMHHEASVSSRGRRRELAESVRRGERREWTCTHPARSSDFFQRQPATTPATALTASPGEDVEGFHSYMRTATWGDPLPQLCVAIRIVDCAQGSWLLPQTQLQIKCHLEAPLLSTRDSWLRQSAT
ncbi:somatostatin receptor type 3-like [Schistocerca americana]|uniref:somatostatin receptor type 3-like n=1 Tax=Schistocerca americana TaxID=7009 RepID=UPI001F4FEBFF|nr:somatostatin receptor type 3-like [Schistocerca americana]